MFAVILALLCVSPRLDAGLADDLPKPVIATVRLPSGLTARYEYHFNRNALRDSRVSGAALIALTDSGNLLRFDLATRQLTQERFGPVAVACLGDGDENEVLAGFEDGRVCRVDPKTLNLTEITRLTGPPSWIALQKGGRQPSGKLIAVIERVERDVRRLPRKSAVVQDLGAGKTYEVEQEPTAFLLDGHRRLWLGGDRGEWGGWCSVVDRDAGALRVVPGSRRPPGEDGIDWEGVYGFAEFRDGSVWAFGGTSHMGFNSAFIRRLDEGKTEELYRADNADAIRAQMKNQAVPVSDRPRVPITRIAEEPDGTLLVFTYGAIFRTDRALTRWTRLLELRIRYRWGRPDAVGAYPSVRAVHQLEEKDGGLLCATARDGLVLIANGEQTAHALPGQLEADAIQRIEATAAGTLFLEWDDSSPPWRFRDGNWEPTMREPPVDLDPDEPAIDDPRIGGWNKTHLLVGREGKIITISATAGLPGTRTTARWSDGEPEILGRENSWLNPSACFITPDGTLWNAWSGTLERFHDGEWTVVAGLPGAVPGGIRNDFGFSPGDEGLKIGSGLRVVSEDGPPWVLLDRDRGHLLNLAPGRKPSLDLVSISEGDEPLRVHDAIAWTDRKLLLATDRGLRLFDRSTDQVHPSSLPALDGTVKLLRRDGLGRLWLAGDGLWMLEPGANQPRSASSLPMLGRTEVTALASDPKQSNGVIAAIGRRGIIFVRIAEGQRDHPEPPR